jgi:hypothetical protein
MLFPPELLLPCKKRSGLYTGIYYETTPYYKLTHKTYPGQIDHLSTAYANVIGLSTAI